MADDETARERVPTTEQERRGLLIGLFVPPLVWLGQQQASYALVTWTCSTGHRFVLVLIALIAMVASLFAGYLAWTSWPGEGRLAGEPRGVEGARLLSLSGVASGVVFAIVIAASTIPTFILGPCD